MGITGFRVEIGLVDLSDRVGSSVRADRFFPRIQRQIRLEPLLQIMNRHHSQPSGIRQ